MNRSRLWGVAAVLIIGAARLAIPAAPALYEGPIGPAEPYHYCNPPAHMTTVNTKPAGGAGDLLPQGDASQLGSISAGDNQVLAFFPKGALKAPGAARFHVTTNPNCSTPPSPPPGNTLVGNAYDINALGQPGDLPVTFVVPAQVLLKTPPVQYSSVQLYYSDTWHSVQWGQQGDIANVSLNHSGTLAALDDGRANPSGKSPQQQSSGITYVIEAVLLAVAIGIVGAAVLVQLRRAAEEASSTGPKGAGKRTNRKPRKR